MTQNSLPAFSEASTAGWRYRAVHDLVLDYALAAAIVGLNPFPNLLIVTLIVITLLLFKMRHDIKKQWGFSNRHGFWAIVDRLLGIIGALSMAFMAWLTVIVLSAFIPLVHRFAISAALFTLVWMVGFAINHSYLSAYPLTQPEDAQHG